ncbi:unnamed protein product, partial [Clonostachys rhizophaga]
MLDDNNSARYWPDNYPNSEDSTNANKLTRSKDEPKLLRCILVLTRKFTRRIRKLLKQIFWRLNKNAKKYAAKKLRRRSATKNIFRSHGYSTANPCPVNELYFGYLRDFGAVLQPVAPAPGEAPRSREAPGPENRADFTNFIFAAKEEDTEGPGISSVPPLIASGKDRLFNKTILKTR